MKIKQTKAAKFRLKLISLSALSLMLLALACGKTGMPQPQDPKRNFAFAVVNAEAVGNCLAFEGQLTGAYQNIDSLRLELLSMDGVDDCPQCPFMPNEIISFSALEIGLNSDDGSIAFTYCPHEAKAYRWRMLGISRYSTIPHAISHEVITELQP